MKNTIEESGKVLIEFANKFGLIVVAVVISMIARSIYKGTSIKRLLLKIPIAAIMGIILAVLLGEYTDFSSNVITVFCAIIGAYTGEVLDGLEQIFRWLPSFIKEVFSTKLNVKNDKDDELK